MAKVRYEIDPHNRLVVEKIVTRKKKKLLRRRKTHLPRFRKVVDGHFKIDKNNTLIYHVKTPSPRDINIPHQVRLRGEWSLTKKHNLRLTLNKWGRETFGDQLTLQGDIIDVGKNSLLFAITTRTKEGKRSIHALKFRGSWQADKDNRLTFKARREGSKYNTLTFNSTWEINKKHQIIYQYEKADLTRKSKKAHTLTFKGYWDIKEKARISYVIDRNTDSVFHFRPSLGIFKDSYIKYEIGISLSHKPKPIKRTLTLFGVWKIKRSVGLIFEVKYEKGKLRTITFGADARLTGKDTILFKLKNDTANKDIGISIKLSHKTLKGDGEAFVRLIKSKRESAIYVGAGRRW